MDQTDGDKQFARPSGAHQLVEVWSDHGWTLLKRIIQHRTTKPIVRVTTNTGSVDVTTDHSLLQPNGGTVAPSELVLGDALMHHALPVCAPSRSDDDQGLSLDMAQLFGVIVKYGTWTRSSQLVLSGLPVLDVAVEVYRLLCSDVLDVRPVSLRTKRAAHATSTLVVEGDCSLLAETTQHGRMVPQALFLSSEGVCRAFWRGFTGGRTFHSTQRHIVRGKMLAAGLYWCARQLNFDVSITDQGDTYELAIGVRDALVPRPIHTVKSMEVVFSRHRSAGLLVYDLETEDHHFAAGVGEMVVHNTDSVFLYFKDKVSHDDTETITGLTRLIEPMLERVNTLFPKQVKLDFEKVFKDLILLSKKRYIGDTVSPAGVPLDHLVRGCALVRRDFGPLVQTIYRTISDTMLRDSCKQTPLTMKAWEQELNLVISTYIRSMFERRRLDIVDYVLSCGIARPRAGYKQVGAHPEPKHILLWDRVEARQDQLLNNVRVKSGTNVFTPGMRIEFVAIDTPVLPNSMLFEIDWNQHQMFIQTKQKLQVHYLEELDYYMQFKHVVKLNLLWYLESQMANPLSELMHAVFQTERSVMEEQVALHKLRRKIGHLILTRSRPWIHDEQTGAIVGRAEPPSAAWTMLSSERSQRWYLNKLKRLGDFSHQSMRRQKPFASAKRSAVDELNRLMRLGVDERWYALLLNFADGCVSVVDT